MSSAAKKYQRSLHALSFFKDAFKSSKEDSEKLISFSAEIISFSYQQHYSNDAMIYFAKKNKSIKSFNELFSDIGYFSKMFPLRVMGNRRDISPKSHPVKSFDVDELRVAAHELVAISFQELQQDRPNDKHFWEAAFKYFLLVDTMLDTQQNYIQNLNQKTIFMFLKTLAASMVLNLVAAGLIIGLSVLLMCPILTLIAFSVLSAMLGSIVFNVGENLRGDEKLEKVCNEDLKNILEKLQNTVSNTYNSLSLDDKVVSIYGYLKEAAEDFQSRVVFQP